MSSGISGNYDGEGPNVSAAVVGTAPGPSTPSPDVYAKRGTLNNGIVGGQGIGAMVPVDRRGRLRTSSEAARSGRLLDVSGGDVILTVATRYIYCRAAGAVVVRFVDDTADVTISAINAGVILPLAVTIIRQVGTSGTFVLLF